MALFRPSNLNKRLVSSTGGNAGVIGPTKQSYLNGALVPGRRCCGGFCCGRFTLSESFCGVLEKCSCTTCDFCGFLLCCGPTTEKWFVAPSCTEVVRNWYSRGDAVTVANSCMGSLGWFVPDIGQLQNPGFACYPYWDSCYQGGGWSNQQRDNFVSNQWAYTTDRWGNAFSTNKDIPMSVRAFRCTPT